jgi:hypothetical protein
MPFLGRIPFDPVFTKAMVQGINIFEYAPEADICGDIKAIWNMASEKLNTIAADK